MKKVLFVTLILTVVCGFLLMNGIQPVMAAEKVNMVVFSK